MQEKPPMNQRLKKLLGWGWETYEDHSLIHDTFTSRDIYSLTSEIDCFKLLFHRLIPYMAKFGFDEWACSKTITGYTFELDSSDEALKDKIVHTGTGCTMIESAIACAENAIMYMSKVTTQETPKKPSEG